MGNLCDIFSFNKECNKEYIKNDKKNTNHVPFLDISNIYYDEYAEPPSYSQLRNAKSNEYNEFLAHQD
jgi:hypothetical protein